MHDNANPYVDRRYGDPVGDADRQLVAAIRAELRAAADPARAPQMQAYMKSEMPYLGVSVPAVRAITRRIERSRPITAQAALIDTVRLLWRAAGFREERYAATALTGTARAARLRGMELLDLYREMITTGAWWDHVDEVSHRVGDLYTAFPKPMRAVLLSWGSAEDIWLRRSAIISQLGAKENTDTTLLGAVVDANLDRTEFFLRKAIGWALREYARTDPGWVRAFVTDRESELSALSRREALKHLQ
jgi:3-methyladenine DNA glycosylase AlkD